MEDKINFSDLSILWNKELGQGYISKVYLGIDKRTSKQYAVKIVK